MTSTSRRPALSFPNTRKRALLLAAGAAASVGLFGGRAQGQMFTWGLSADGPWDTTTSTWQLNGAGSLTTWVNGNEAQFGGFVGSHRTVSTTSGLSASGLTFNAIGRQPYDIGATAFTLDNGAGAEFVTITGVEHGKIAAVDDFFGGSGGGSNVGPFTFTDDLVVNNDGPYRLLSLRLGALTRGTPGGTLTVNGQGNTAISGAIGASLTGGLVKNGSGTLHLSSATNAFSGGLAVNGGILSAASDGALGNAANTIVLSNGTLFRASASFTLGSGRSFSLTNGTTVGLTVNNATLTLGTANQLGSSNATLNLITSTFNSGGITITEANNSFTGLLTVGSRAMEMVGHIVAQRPLGLSNALALTLSGNGQINGCAGITVNTSRLLAITQGNPAVIGRLGLVPLTFNAGRFQYNTNSNGGVATIETLGSVDVNGYMGITGSSVFGDNAGATLNFASLNRSDHATMTFRSNSGTGNGSIGGGAATNGVNYKFGNLSDVGFSGSARNVVPWAGWVDGITAGAHSRPMTYDGNGFRPLVPGFDSTPAASQAAWDAAVATVQNINYGTANLTVSGTTTVNSLFATAACTFNGNGATLVNSSGFHASSATTTFNGPTYSAPNGAYFHLGNTVTFQNQSSLTGSGGVVASNFGNLLRLVFTNPGGNTFTGGLYLNNSAGVSFTQNNQLGNDGGGAAAGAITLNGGQLLYTPAAAATVSLSDSGTNRPIAVSLCNGAIATATASAVLQVPGTISGPGQMQFGSGQVGVNSGVVELTGGANTYTGGTIVQIGTLRISNPSQLGPGPVFLESGVLQAGADLAIAVPMTVVGQNSGSNLGSIDTQAFTVTVNGGLEQSGGNNGAVRMLFVKRGTGTLNIASPSGFAGDVTVGKVDATGGTMRVSGAGSLSHVFSFTVAEGGTLVVDDSAQAVPDRVRGGDITMISNGLTGSNSTTFTLITHASGTSLQLGRLVPQGGTVANPHVATVSIDDGGTSDGVITFQSLSAIGVNTTLHFVGSANLGKSAPGGSRVFFRTPPTLVGNVIPGVTFTGFGGTGPATYDAQRGVILYAPCYANCDESTVAPTLNVADFTCFLQRFAAADAYANCDGSTEAPTLNVADFTCFLQKYAGGCP